MAERRKTKKRKEEYVAPGEDVLNKPTKDQFAVAKWLRKNVPIKKTKFMNHNVEYFTGKRAVDALLESKFATSDEPLFKTREEIVDYLDVMLEQKFYHRARKVPISESELRGKKKEKKTDKDTEKKDKKEKLTDAESSVVEGKDKDKEAVVKEKIKKKIRLDMHNDQRFVDGLDAYVWIYDPIPFHYWIIGTFVVLGCIGLCLFPLWPPAVRILVYYLSVAAAGFLVFVLALAVLRLVFFCLVWVATAGKHHIWILPNLTEDVGFFASFWPLYTYEYRPTGAKPKSKKKKKSKDSDAEDETGDGERAEQVEVEEIQDTNERHSEAEGDVVEGNADQEENEAVSDNESDKSNTSRDFEIVEKSELESMSKSALES